MKQYYLYQLTNPETKEKEIVFSISLPEKVMQKFKILYPSHYIGLFWDLHISELKKYNLIELGSKEDFPEYLI